MVDGDRTRVFENDDYWLTPRENALTGNSYMAYEYLDEGSLKNLAAYWCAGNAFRRLRTCDHVAVANVFVKRETILRWVMACRELGIVLKIHEPQTKWKHDLDVCAVKNIHGAPLNVIESMAAGWEEITQEEIDSLLNVPDFKKAG